MHQPPLQQSVYASSGGGVGLAPGGSPVTTTGTTTGGTTTSGTTTGPATAVQSGNVTVSTTGDGITLQTNASGILRKALTLIYNSSGKAEDLSLLSDQEVIDLATR